MARKRFLRNLQRAAGFLSPESYPNGIRLGPDEIKSCLLARGTWPTAAAVHGFDPADFAADLVPGALDQLAQDVATCQRIPDESSSSTEEGQRAILAFASILTAMQPYLDGFKVYAAVARRRDLFPDFVRDFAIRVGDDSTGDPAAWVWVIVADGTPNKELFPAVEPIQQLVTDALEDADIELHPYVLFRSSAKQARLEGAARR